jgi:3-methyladenine DNA glycosylase/8-oxoguanine DNA glycosylase
MLRQDPLECLFQFVCSSNNHISRIHGMVERLCSAYGTPLAPSNGLLAGGGGAAAAAAAAAAVPAGLSFYAFPTLEQLSAASEETLRADGFGWAAPRRCLLRLSLPVAAGHCWPCAARTGGARRGRAVGGRW